ncbi:hypothetical protein [Vibrio sp. WXL210]|uniref:hypothetical protein n=1 Tax=Vibrio sp. WXL210 TaxID=3450709 RepID=UPI003EC7B9E0
MIPFTMLATFCCALPVQSSGADSFIAMDEFEPMSVEQLDQYRGGFQLADDYVINIGLSVTTAINGELVYSASIANLMIENGILTATNAIEQAQAAAPLPPLLDQGVVNIVQVGEGNFVEGITAPSSQTVTDDLGDDSGDSSVGSVVTSGGATTAPANATPANIAAAPSDTSPTAPLVTTLNTETLNANLINVIQNTMDDSILGLNTIVDIDVQADNTIRRIRANQQLNDALLNHLH